MLKESFQRTSMLIGEENVKKLTECKILLFGLGGVGGNCAEALARAGIGFITIVDGDKVDVTNINRQIFATEKTVGKDKVIAATERLKEINSSICIEPIKIFYGRENNNIDFTGYDYIIDAIDDVGAKVEIISEAYKCGVPIISSMGTGNKIHPEMLEITNLHKTKICPLARIMRKKLKEIGITDVKVIYSIEEPYKRLTPPASISFVPPVAGIMMAGEVVRDITGLCDS